MRDFVNLHADARVTDVTGKAGVALLTGAGLAWLAPFGTVDQSIFVRLGFWTAMSVAWFAVSSGVAFLLAHSARFRRLPRWPQLLFTVGVSALPGIVIAGYALVAMQNWRPDLIQVVDLYTQTMLVGFVLELVWFAILGHSQSERSTEALASTAVPRASLAKAEPASWNDAPEIAREETEQRTPAYEPMLSHRVPPDVRGAILCLQMEDHYVRIHTEAGSALVLMRFSDAVLELHHVPGLKVHRSWWVALDAIGSVERKGRTAQLRLKNGLTVPVSQPYMTDVSALGRHPKTVDDGLAPHPGVSAFCPQVCIQ